MPDFNKGSTFNKDANFQGVKFGADAPLLETELNELQDIQTEARAEIIRDSIPSGFVQLGELDYDYMLNNENCVKMKTDSVAYVNGYKILIPKDTIVDIGKAPEKDAREDLLFLEVWKEEVTKDSQLTVAGGEGQASTTNNILDPRVGQETSRRVALRWRIRHVANVDFTKFYDGLGRSYDSASYSHDFVSIAQGGLSEVPNITLPTTTSSTLTTYHFYRASDRKSSSIKGKQVCVEDVGVFVAGDGSDFSKTNLKSVDGYVYAIPMFRLYRKPSCGKAIPFEYQKINPKVDYSKFTALMKEEKVERVVSETVEGRSLVNLAVAKTTTLNKNFYWAIVPDNTLKSETEYTLVFDITNIVGLTTGKFLRLALRPNTGNSVTEDVNIAISSTGFTKGTIKYKIPSQAKIVRAFIHLNGGVESDSIILDNLMILEGDWTNKEIPEHFTGLKSLGEDEGNLITVKNAILNESSYDPDTGTPKLNTVEGTNHITSYNLIMPTIEAQVKRGDNKLSDLNAFGKVDSLVGDEVVDFTKIKGRTLQNLHDKSSYVFCTTGITNEVDYTVKSDVRSLEITRLTQVIPRYQYINAGYANFHKLKPNTKYTVVFGECVNIYKVTLQSGDTANKISDSAIVVDNKAIITTEESVTSNAIIVYLHLKNNESNTKVKDIAIYEGDYSDTPLDQIPFIEGIKSVGENEDNKVVVKRTGKNLFDMNKCESFNDKNDHYTPNKLYKYNEMVFNLKPNTKYVLTIKKIKGSNCWIGFRIDGTYANNKNLDIFTHEFTSNSSGKCSIYIGANTEQDISSAKVEYIQLEELISTDFEPYKEEYKQKITLKEPLRSLPNEVCDTIEGNKVIRRVGKIVLDGSENWGPTGTDGTTTKAFYIRNILKGLHDKNLICDRFIPHPYVVWNPSEVEGISLGGGTSTYSGFDVRIKSSKLSTQDVQGFKTWLSQNPITVYYELANPVEELIEPNYDKESIKTYQLDQPLRSLPNGVKDEIVGNKLIRRCGEIILNGGEAWSLRSEALVSDTLLFQCTYTPMKRLSSLYCDRFLQIENDLWSQNIEGIRVYQTSNFFHIRINKSKLSSPDATGFKAWLKANPTKVVYELATPIEIPLKEVLPSQANFSLARQFNYSDNYLLELPNGVKDTVENGKVTRRVKKIVLNGSEDWVDSSSLVLANTIGFRVIPSDKKVNTEIFCDKFKYVHHNSLTTLDEEFITGQGTTSQVYIRIAKSRLSSPDLTGFKAWLSNNPITVLYELNTPTTEELSGNNYMYCPSHEINTYCGSMYVGNGTNDTFVENGLRNDNVVIDTPFRSITNKEVVTDCKYKKSIDGYDAAYNSISKISKNLIAIDNSFLRHRSNFLDKKGIVISDNKLVVNYIGSDLCGVVAKVKPNTTYSLKVHDYTIPLDKFRIFTYAKEPTYFYISDTDSNKVRYFFGVSSLTLTTGDSENYIGIGLYCADNVSLGQYISKIQLQEGDNATPYVNPILESKIFENTEENDIEDLRHQVSLTGFNYEELLNKSFDSLLRGEL